MTNETPAAAAAGKGGRYTRLADEELIFLAGEGDAGAFAALHGRHSRAAHFVAWRMTGGRQAAEDLAQEAFRKAWRWRAPTGPTGAARAPGCSPSSASRRRTRDRAEAEAPGSQPSEAFTQAWRNHLGLPLGTVKGRARLGLEKLRHNPELRALALG